jgi:hypothetical protein
LPARAQDAGIDLPPLLQGAGLTVRDIEDESIRLSVAAQIDCLNMLAEALNDRLLGFHVAQDMDLRRTGFLYYVAASSDILANALQGIARCSTMFNEGDAGLQANGNNLFVATPASGPPQDGVPGTNGAGTLLQGSLEQSNVSAVTEISNLIAAQRAYEMNSKVITAADEMLQTTSQLMK